jgi:O-methyltransferase
MTKMNLQNVKTLLRRALPSFLRERAEEVRHFGLPLPFRKVRSYSLLSLLNLFFLQELMRRIDREGIPGDVVECGVYRGGSAGVLGYELIRSRFERRLWLFDAFQGMPPASEQDDDYSRSIEGQFVGSESQTRRLLQRFVVPETRYQIVRGWFEDTLPMTETGPVALLHVDCDFYDPVKRVLETFYERLTPGGHVVLNDYGSFAGCRKATDDFLQDLGSSVQLIPIDHEAFWFQKTQGQP